MTLLEAQRELESYRQELLYIKNKEEDILKLRLKLTSGTRWPDMSSGTQGGNEGDGGMSDLAALVEAHEKLLARCEGKRLLIEYRLEQIGQPWRNILYLRYIKGRRVEEVAGIMSYSLRQMCRLYKEALRRYAEISTGNAFFSGI